MVDSGSPCLYQLTHLLRRYKMLNRIVGLKDWLFGECLFVIFGFNYFQSCFHVWSQWIKAVVPVFFAGRGGEKLGKMDYSSKSAKLWKFIVVSELGIEEFQPHQLLLLGREREQWTMVRNTEVCEVSSIWHRHTLGREVTKSSFYQIQVWYLTLLQILAGHIKG